MLVVLSIFNDNTYLIMTASIIKILFLFTFTFFSLQEITAQDNYNYNANNSLNVKFIKSLSSNNDIKKNNLLDDIVDLIFGDDEIQLQKPISIAANDSSDLIILDQGLRNLVSFNLFEKKIRLIESDFDFPSLVSICKFEENKYLFTDSRNNNIYIYDLVKRSIKLFSTSIELNQPTGIGYLQSTKDIWVSETGNHSIVILDREGKLKKRVGLTRHESDKELEVKKITMKTLFNFIESERSRLAIELHDDVGQKLMITKLYLEMLKKECIQFPEKFDEIIDLIQTTNGDIKKIVFALHPAELENYGLVSAIQSRLNHCSNIGNFKAEFNIFGKAQNLNMDAQLGIYRICQEAFSNVTKHAKATKIIVEINFNKTLIVGVINDDGCGFNLNEASNLNNWSNHQICLPCHTPHDAKVEPDAPLWNHTLAEGTGYTLYSGYEMDATVGQPDGTSKLCLSCHDGTVAIDSYGGTTGGTFIDGGFSVGRDLSHEHPISFIYNSALATADGELHDPSTVNSGLGGTIHNDLLSGPVNLGKMQCSSCHDVHRKVIRPNLLVKGNTASALCLTCHNK